MACLRQLWRLTKARLRYEVDIDQVESVDFTLSVIPYRSGGGFSTADIDYADAINITY